MHAGPPRRTGGHATCWRFVFRLVEGPEEAEANGKDAKKKKTYREIMRSGLLSALAQSMDAPRRTELVNLLRSGLRRGKIGPREVR